MYGAVPVGDPKKAGDSIVDQNRQSLVWTTWAVTFLFAGSLYGFASLQLMLEKDGVMHSTCGTALGDICETQSDALALIYSVGSTMQIFSSMLVGYTIDRAGPLRSIAIASACMVSGILMFAVSDPDSISSYLIAVCLIALGGNFTYLTGFTCSFIVPSSKMSHFQTVNSCLYDSSCVIFLAFYEIQETFHVNMRHILLVYGLVGTIMYGKLLRCWYLNLSLLDRRKSEALLRCDETEGVGSQFQIKPGEGEEEGEEEGKGMPPYSALHALPWNQQVLTPQFVIITVFSSLHLLRASWYMGAMRNMLERLGDEATGNKYTTLYGVIVPAGFLFIPWVNRQIHQNYFCDSLRVVTGLSFVYGVVACIDSLFIQPIGFISFCAFRALFYSTMGTMVSHTFGPISGNTTNGCLWLVASFFNVLIYPMSVYVESSGNWITVNLVLLVIGLPVFYLHDNSLRKVLLNFRGASRPVAR